MQRLPGDRRKEINIKSNLLIMAEAVTPAMIPNDFGGKECQLKKLKKR